MINNDSTKHKMIAVIVLTVLLSVMLSGCTPAEEKFSNAVAETLVAHPALFTQTANPTYTLEATFTPRPTYTPQSTLTVLPTLTPAVFYVTPTVILPTATATKEIVYAMNRNVPCGEEFIINVYGKEYLSPTSFVVRLEVTNNTATTLSGIHEDSFILQGQRAGSSVTYHPDLGDTNHMNTGVSGEVLGKEPWDDETQYTPLTAVKSVIAYDVDYDAKSLVFVFKPFQHSQCQVSIPLK